MNGSTEDRHIAVPKYFKKTPEEPVQGQSDVSQTKLIIGGVVAVIGLLMLLSGDGCLSGLGVLAILGGGGYALVGFVENSNKSKASDKAHAKAMKEYQKAYDEAEPKPSDMQMDDWLSGDIKRLTEDAFDKLDIEEFDPDTEQKPPNMALQDPLIIYGPSRSGTNVQVGKDVKVRFSRYDVVIVFLTKYHLAAYNCELLMAEGVTSSESTQEYHYQDVVSVATRTESEDFVLRWQGESKSIPSFQEFTLAVTDQHMIRIVTFIGDISELLDFDEKGSISWSATDSDNAVKVIRRQLRVMKGGDQA